MKTSFVIFCALTLSACASGFKDLRPTEMRDASPTAEQVARGRALLDRAAERAGGRARFSQFDHLRASATDDWDSFLGELAFLQYDKHQELDIWVKTPEIGDTFIDLKNGSKKGQRWGVEDGAQYRIIDGKRVPDNEPLSGLFIKATGVLMALPIHLSYADQVAYVDDVEFEGATYHRVFATWEQMAPQEKFDHWLVWINRETGLIEQAEFTVREYEATTAFPVTRSGAYSMSDFREVDGMKIPHTIKTLFALGEDAVHVYKISDVKFVAKDTVATDAPSSQPAGGERSLSP